jgi:hypothetical protein
VKPHQQVFQITQSLLQAGTIRGVLVGSEWEFWLPDSIADGSG